MIPTGATFHVVDLTKEQQDPPRYSPPHCRVQVVRPPSRARVLRRKPSSVDGIVLHQTACPYGVTAEQLAASDGDRVLAKHRRALGVAAHMTAFDTGYAVLAHPLDWYVYHANSFNARSVGIEIEGAYPCNQDSRELLTGSLLRAARDGLSYLVAEGRKRGMPLKFIWAHRQSSMMREDDPGEEIWRKLVLEFAVPELGLVTQPTFTCGGKALPPEWLRARPGGR